MEISILVPLIIFEALFYYKVYKKGFSKWSNKKAIRIGRCLLIPGIICFVIGSDQ